MTENIERSPVLKIAFVTPEFSEGAFFSGGLANYIGRVSEALATQGHDVTVFTRSDRNDSRLWRGVQLEEVVPWYGTRFRLDRLDRLFRGRLYSPYQDVKAAWCLWKRFQTVARDKGGFDVLQLANVQAVGLFFRQSNAARVMITRLSSYRPLWDQRAGVEPDRFVRLRWWLEATAVRRTRYHYAPSAFVAKEGGTGYGLPKVDVVETPFFQEVVAEDPSVFESRFSGLRYVLFFGRLTQMKGVHRLAEALPAVLAGQPDLHAVFIGADTNLAPGGGSMRRYIQERVGTALAGRVHLLDPLRHPQLYPLIRGAEWVVLPSIVDNLPNTCLEAMGLGRPVIATTGSCFEQLIADGDTGLLCAPDDAGDLGNTLQRALSLPPENREALGRQGQESLVRLHPDASIPHLLGYYSRIAGS